ncbi:MAG TPA: hypothetical protein VIS48_04675 [Candidatus Kryptonia bacterium]
MKSVISLLVLTAVFSSISYGQQYPRPLLAPGQSQISGGLGVSWIDGTPYYMIGVMPDLSFGKIGVGLDLTLRINSQSNKIRKVDWSDGAYRKIIRYVRWGDKHDPVYVQVGQLDMATLGHGLIVYNYNNSASFDDRKIGAEVDIDFTKYGFEAMYGDFQQAGLVGGRAYARPLRFTQLGAIPIIGGFEIGATYVTDQNKNSAIVMVPTMTMRPGPTYGSVGRMSEYGFDAGLPVLRTPFVDADLYYDYAQFVDFGHGNAAGILGTFRGLGAVTASVKLERQWIGDRFIPEYFDQLYEIERFDADSSGNFLSSKAEQLDGTKKSQGWYGSLLVSVLGQFYIVGAYRGIDHDPNGGLLHLETQLPNVIPIVVFSAGYDRHTNNTLKDAFKLDGHSLLYAFFGYKPYPFMTVGFNYYWTFTPVEGHYVVQRRIEPRVMFNFTF